MRRWGRKEIMRFAALSLLWAFGCGPARPPLPPAPPPASPNELSIWGKAPPLAPVEQAEVRLDTSHFRLENGLGVSVSVTAGPSTSIALRVPTARDRSRGAVTAMASAMRAGTRDDKGEPFFNPRLALAPIGIWTDAVATTFTWRVPQLGTQRALSLLGQFVRRPVFDPGEVQVRLQQQLASIRDGSAPLNQLQELARAGIPGLERPSNEHDARGIFKLTPPKLQQIHRCAMQPDSAELVVVGPVQPDAVKAWATEAFGVWRVDPSATAASCAEWLTPPFPEQPERARLERPLLTVVYGAAFDPWLAIDVPGPPVESPDYLSFELLVGLLQERSSGSVKKLRHAGATYGIRVNSYDRYTGVSLLEIRGQVEGSQAKTALRGLIEDIRSLAGSIDAAELEAVKRRWRTETVDSWARGDGLAGALQWQLRRGRAAADLAKVLEEGEQIDVERCRAVAERYLSAAQPSIVVTGLTRDLVRGLGLGAELRQMFWTSELHEHKKL